MPFFHCASEEEVFSSGPASAQAVAADRRPTAAGTNFSSSASIAARSERVRRTLDSATVWAGPSFPIGLTFSCFGLGIAAISPPAVPAAATARATQNRRRRIRGERVRRNTIESLDDTGKAKLAVTPTLAVVREDTGHEP